MAVGCELQEDSLADLMGISEHLCIVRERSVAGSKKFRYCGPEPCQHMLTRRTATFPGIYQIDMRITSSYRGGTSLSLASLLSNIGTVGEIDLIGCGACNFGKFVDQNIIHP